MNKKQCRHCKHFAGTALIYPDGRIFCNHYDVIVHEKATYCAVYIPQDWKQLELQISKDFQTATIQQSLFSSI